MSLQQTPNGPNTGYRTDELEMNEIVANINEVVSRMTKKSKRLGLELISDPESDGIPTALSDYITQSSAGSSTGQTIQHCLTRALDCIQTIGGVVVETAVGIGEPAKACYNALNFVIRAYQTYTRSFETLAQLLEMCFQSAEEIDIAYRQMSIKPKLRRMACKQLKLFVDTCEYAMKLRCSRRFKMKAFLRITFLNDDQVQGLLEKHKDLTRRRLGEAMANLSSMLDTVGKNVENVGKSVDNLALTLNSSTDMQKEDQQKKNQRSRLLRVFNMHGPLIDTPDGKAPNPVWEKLLRSHLDRRVKGTGSWLQNDNRFSDWAYKKNRALPILCITGGEGTGKSALAAYIIHCLRQKRSDTSGRAYVSYHFMKRGTKEEGDNIASTISGSLLWQLAESYQPFLRSASSKCDDVSNAYDLWKNLLFTNEDLSKSDCVFFFVFDGFTEPTHIDFLNQLLGELEHATIATHRIRLLITGQKADLERLLGVCAIPMRTIELGSANLTDIELFIEHHMDRAQTQPWGNDVDIKKRIADGLKTSSGGSYRAIRGNLNQISKMKGEEEIETWLKKADVMSMEPIAIAIEELGRRCSPSDVQDINELILWVIGGQGGLSPIQLEAALRLRSQTLTGKPLGGSNRQEFRTGFLKSKLLKDWRQLFYIEDSNDDGDVKFANTPLDIARDVIPSRQRNAEDERHFGNPPDIQPAEVALIQHYLKSMCPPETYEKFGFAKFFEEKLLQRDYRICQDPDTAELTLSLRCLTCLVEKRNKMTQVLHDYATQNLQVHLRSAGSTEADRDGLTQDGALSSSDTDLRAQTGTLLVRLFTEDYAMNSLFQIHESFGNEKVSSALMAKRLPSNWEFWLASDKGVKLLAQYFDDEVVLKSFEDMPLAKLFVRQEKRHMALIDSVAKMAVKCFLMNDATSREVETAFSLLLVAEARSRNQELNDEKDLETHVWTPTAQRVQEVEVWSWQMAPPGLNIPVWDARMASVLLHFYLNGNQYITTEHVQTRAKFARGTSNLTWQVSHTLARAIDVDADAAKVLKELIDGLTKDRKWCNLASNRTILAEIYLDLGDRYWTFDGSPRPDDAVEMHLKSIKQDPSHLQRYLGIISRYATREAWTHIRSFIEALSKRFQSSDGTPIGKLVVQGVLNHWDFCTSLREAAENLNDWGFLKSAYDQSLKEKVSSSIEAFYVRLAYGEALQNAENEEYKLLQVWEDMLEVAASSDLGYLRRRALTYLVPRLVPTYTRRALEAVAVEESITPPNFAKKIDSLYEDFQATTDLSTDRVLYFTRYFVLCEDHKRAKESVSELLAQSLDMMSNDDQSDDVQCFVQLQAIFSTFGDNENTCAAWHMIVVAIEQQFESQWNAWKSQTAAKDGPIAGKDKKPLTETEDSDPNPHTPIKPIKSPVVWCDGCGKAYSSPSGIWTCMDERGMVQLDEECYRRLQMAKDAQGKIVCDEAHKLMRMSECTVEEIMGRMKDKKVRVGKGDLSLDDWKKSIIAKYGV